MKPDPKPMTSTASPAEWSGLVTCYQGRRQGFAKERDGLQRRATLLSNTRLVVFLLAAGGLTAGLWGDTLRPLLAAAGALALVLFAVLVVVHDRVLRRLERSQELLRINEEALARLDRRWDELPLPAEQEQRDTDDPLATDLDLLGRASLYQLLSTANTPAGRQSLVSWLLHPALPAEISRRQLAVAELARELDWRQELSVRGRRIARLPSSLEPFLSWSEEPPWLARRPALLWAARLLGLTAVLLALLHGAGLLAHPWWLLAMAANLGFSALFGRKVGETFGRVSQKEREFLQYAELFQLFSATRFTAEPLLALQQQLTAGTHSATAQMKRLDRLVSLADVRHSGMFHLPLQALTLWDFHVLALLERWQQEVGGEARCWLRLLGEAEALCALGGLKHDHPDWVMPELAEQGPPRVEAEQLGHPLLHPQRCVRNDVSLGPPDTFLLVTGSNMSGKSTLLRALGANIVLAQAGGPVCARAFTLTPTTLGTSFRIRDSLERGVSYFMAELQRLKEVVDQAQACQQQGRTMTYLLDEILLGTNVVERQIAVQRVLQHLLGSGAIGAISTHDLSLATAEKLQPSCHPVHFLESFQESSEGPTMTFDYTLRQGTAPTVNALKLLRMVGLDQEHP